MVKKSIPSVFCPHCGSGNPSTAYCCLSCFKVMREKKGSIWTVRFEPTWTALGIVGIIVLAIALGLKHWIQDIDAQVTMNLQTAENSYSLIAEKKKQNDLTVDTQAVPLPDNPQN